MDKKDQWNKTEDPKIDSYRYSHLIYKVTLQCGCEMIFKKSFLEQWDIHLKREERWIVDLKCERQSKQKQKWKQNKNKKSVFEENVEEKLHDPGAGKII